MTVVAIVGDPVVVVAMVTILFRPAGLETLFADTAAAAAAAAAALAAMTFRIFIGVCFGLVVVVVVVVGC